MLDSKLSILQSAEVKFDEDFGEEFGVSGGVCTGENKNEYYVNPKMWVKAIDTVLDRLVRFFLKEIKWLMVTRYLFLLIDSRGCYLFDCRWNQRICATTRKCLLEPTWN